LRIFFKGIPIIFSMLFNIIIFAVLGNILFDAVENDPYSYHSFTNSVFNLFVCQVKIIKLK
jgi:hypothetical protein